MVYQKQVPVVVMLTRLEEKNRVKADVYWPEEPGSSCQFGKFLVTHKHSKSILPTITRRTFQIRKIESIQPNKSGFATKPRDDDNVTSPNESNDTQPHTSKMELENVCDVENSKNEMTNCDIKEVVQLHYTEWPDFGGKLLLLKLLLLLLLKLLLLMLLLLFVEVVEFIVDVVIVVEVIVVEVAVVEVIVVEVVVEDVVVDLRIVIIEVVELLLLKLLLLFWK